MGNFWHGAYLMGATQQALLLAGGAFDPVTLFSGGTNGFMFDFTDSATLFDDAGRTTPASLNGQVLGVTDLSGNGNHVSSASTTILMRSGYIEFPGGVAGFSGTATLGSTDGWTSGFAFRPDTTTLGRWMDADRNGTRIATPGASNTGVYAFIHHTVAGTPSVNDSGISTGTDYAAVIIAERTALTSRRNKAQTAQTTFATGSPSSGAGIVFAIGSGYQGTNSLAFDHCDGRLYACFFAGRVLTGAEIANLEDWLYAKAGL
jgi:hypothetical protein